MTLVTPTIAIALILGACGARTTLPTDGAMPHDASVDSRFEPDASDAAIRLDTSKPFDAPSESDASDASIDAPASLCSATDAGSAPIDCYLPLTAGTITPSSPSCYVDVQVMTGEKGAVNYACNGGGAVVTFGAHTFSGVLVHGQLQVCFGTTFAYSDGCTWQSRQNIVGPLSSGTLTYDYAEMPLPGQMNCASPCTATGTILVP